MMQKPYLPPKPTLPKPNNDEVINSYNILSTTERVNHWAGYGSEEEEYQDEDEDEDEDVCDGNVGLPDRRKISLAKVMKKIPPDVDINSVYFTASFSEDYLNLHVKYDKKIKLYDKQMNDYNDKLKAWNKEKAYYDDQIIRYQAKLEEELASIKQNV